MIVMNVNLLSNRKPKQQGETFSLPGWKNSSGCDMTTQRVCCVRSSKANPFTSGCINFRTSTLTRHVESQDHQNAVKEVHMASNFERAVVNSVALLFLFFQMY